MTAPAGLRPGAAAPLAAVDLAYGIPLGNDPTTSRLRRSGWASPRASIEAVIGRALRRAPCVISFSGGRDSSALLALAAHVARRDGLPLPIPATLTFPGVVAADESRWQREVLNHLGITSWHRVEVRGELDAVGPVAATVLRRHGLVWPFNTHFHEPLVALAAGGSLVTGFGGDELGRSASSARAEQVLALRRPAHVVDALVVGLALSPPKVREAVQRRRGADIGARMPWLTPEGVDAVRNATARTHAAIPFGWGRVLRTSFATQRYFTVCQHSFGLLGATHDVAVSHPFVAPEVLGALARAGGVAGVGNRTELLRMLCGDLLPAAVVERDSKGTFTDPLWTPNALDFAQRWSGRGVNPDLVDPDRLRAHWLSEERNLLSTTLLQAAWLHDDAASGWSAAHRVDPLEQDGHRMVEAGPLARTGQLEHR